MTGSCDDLGRSFTAHPPDTMVGELKRRTGPLVAGSRQTSPVGFHDRTADRESHTHTAGLGGEKGLKQPVRAIGGSPRRNPSHLGIRGAPRPGLTGSPVHPYSAPVDQHTLLVVRMKSPRPAGF